MIKKNIKVAAIQMDCITNDKASNISNALNLIEKAAKNDAQLIVLPERQVKIFRCAGAMFRLNACLP